MTERTFDLELNELREKVAYLAGITRRVLDTSSQLLTEQDLSLRTEIVRLEKESDLLENGDSGQGLHPHGPLSAGGS